MPDAAIPRDEPTIVTGDRLADDGSIKVVKDVEDRILRIFKSATPLIVLQNQTKKTRTSHYYKFSFFERDLQPDKLTVAAAGAAGATSIVFVLNDKKKAAKHQVYMNTRTREQVLLTENPASDTFSNLARAIGGGGADVAVGDSFELQGTVHPEADEIGTIKSVVENEVENFTEILRVPAGWSGRTANTEYYGGPEPKELKFDAMQQIKIRLERRAFFGRKHSRTTTNSKGATVLQTFTGGAEHFIKSHIWDLNGNALTERGLVEWQEDVMALGDNGYINRGGDAVKWLFAGNSLITEIEFFARDRLRYEPLSSKIGMRAAQFSSTHGTLNIIRQPQFTGDHSGWGFVFDMAHFKRVNHKGRDLKLYANRQSPSFDGEEVEYMVDAGWQLDNQAAFGIVKNHRIRS